MKKTLLLAAAAGLTSLVGTASAESIAVSAGIPGYCDVTFANGSSNTASIAMEDAQTIARFRVACNSGGGAQLTLGVTNADFQHTTADIIVNYAAELRSPDLPALKMDERDFSPGNKTETSSAPYSPALADGVEVALWVNMNVDAPGPFPDGQTLFPATSAPAGTYEETFTLTATAL